MPHRNRVTPFSRIEADPARGLCYGNRGILHDERGALVTDKWRHKAWIICELQWKNWRRKLLQPNRYTELFFLDEATALAAGHRPCGYCRRESYLHYLKLAGEAGAKALDAKLHPQRTGEKEMLPWQDLPDQSMFAIGATAYLKLEQGSLPWTHSGYLAPVELAADLKVAALTPLLSRQILAAGYKARLHPTAFH